MTDYADEMTLLTADYEPKAMAVLSRIKEALTSEGLVVNGPYSMCDDMIRWWMLAKRPGRPDESGVDITVEVAEERDYDDAEGWGVNFGLDIVHYGGRVIGGLQPFNYTPEVWVDSRDSQALAARWAFIEASSVPDVVKLVTDGIEMVQEAAPRYRGARSDG